MSKSLKSSIHKHFKTALKRDIHFVIVSSSTKTSWALEGNPSCSYCIIKSNIWRMFWHEKDTQRSRIDKQKRGDQGKVKRGIFAKRDGHESSITQQNHGCEWMRVTDDNTKKSHLSVFAGKTHDKNIRYDWFYCIVQESSQRHKCACVKCVSTVISERVMRRRDCSGSFALSSPEGYSLIALLQFPVHGNTWSSPDTL